MPETGSGTRRFYVLPHCTSGYPTGVFHQPLAPSSLENSPPVLPKELLCLFYLLSFFYPLPPSAPRLGDTTHSLSHNSNTFLFPAVPEPRKSFSKSLGKVLPTAALILTSPSGCFPGYQGPVERKTGSIVSNWAVPGVPLRVILERWVLQHTEKKGLNMAFFHQTALGPLYLTASPRSLLKALFEICSGNCSRGCLVHLLATGHLHQPSADR